MSSTQGTSKYFTKISHVVHDHCYTGKLHYGNLKNLKTIGGGDMDQNKSLSVLERWKFLDWQGVMKKLVKETSLKALGIPL